jgi:hypothetical protein
MTTLDACRRWLFLRSEPADLDLPMTRSTSTEVGPDAYGPRSIRGRFMQTDHPGSRS